MAATAVQLQVLLHAVLDLLPALLVEQLGQTDHQQLMKQYCETSQTSDAVRRNPGHTASARDDSLPGPALPRALTYEPLIVLHHHQDHLQAVHTAVHVDFGVGEEEGRRYASHEDH